VDFVSTAVAGAEAGGGAVIRRGEADERRVEHLDAEGHLFVVGQSESAGHGASRAAALDGQQDFVELAGAAEELRAVAAAPGPEG